SRELIARVRALLRRHERLQEMLAADRAEGTATLSLGPLLVDPTAHSARLYGEPLDLTRTEFGLLHLLLRNKGRAFSRAYLHDAEHDRRGGAHRRHLAGEPIEHVA